MKQYWFTNLDGTRFAFKLKNPEMFVQLMSGTPDVVWVRKYMRITMAQNYEKKSFRTEPDELWYEYKEYA